MPIDGSEIVIDEVSILEVLKGKLTPYLKEYFQERVGDKIENEKKIAFLREFNKLTLKEKITYRDYVLNVFKNPEFIKDDDDIVQHSSLISAMNKAEIGAGLYNNTNFINVQEQHTPTNDFFIPPSFAISNGEIKEENGRTIKIGDLGNEYLGNGEYQLFLGDMGLKEGNNFSQLVTGKTPDSLIISRNEQGLFDIYSNDSELPGFVEIKNLKPNGGKLDFGISRLGLKFSLQIANLK